ncbi:AlpA family phage regulatory protein [Labrys neptuniae]|uniref:helix-turn-helix transcriptional regulator n=1 Tax=Labrys neptuniae TaxID=376174 RepID=UPI00288DB2C1|nr:AlpA family phage regulatory protein [Labrys neptuniae]MDT3381173.1 AlpA family phage regulatory protein [Labrys neptuniae]
MRMLKLITRTGFSRTTIYRRVQDGTLPRPIFIGSTTMAWRESQIDEWIATRPPRAIDKARAAPPNDREKL